MSGERRRYPRLAISLPIGHRPVGSAGQLRCDFTLDIAPGGVHFSVAGSSPKVGDRLDLELMVPPGEGYSPYEGKVRGVATVLRCKAAAPGPSRWMVAAKFDQPLNLEF